MGKSVPGKRTIKCKGPRVETWLLSVWARRNGMAGKNQRMGVKRQTKGFSCGCWPRMLRVRAYVISFGLDTITLSQNTMFSKLITLEKQPYCKDRQWEGISNMQITWEEKWQKKRGTGWKEQKPSLEENIQKNRRKFFTCFYGYRLN